MVSTRYSASDWFSRQQEVLKVLYWVLCYFPCTSMTSLTSLKMFYQSFADDSCIYKSASSIPQVLSMVNIRTVPDCFTTLTVGKAHNALFTGSKTSLSTSLSNSTSICFLQLDKRSFKRNNF